MPDKSNAILTVGSLAFDSIRTPAGNADAVLGGSVNYFSIAASFYVPVKVVGVVGSDFPKKHLEWLGARGVDVSGIEFAEGKTFHWVGEYGENLNEAKTLSTALNVFEHFRPKLDKQHCDSPYVFLANIDPVLQLEVLDQINDPRIVVLDSMNFWITGKPEEFKATLKRVDILSINEGEAALLSGESNLMRAAHKIREMGPKVVIIKRGEYGALLFNGDDIFVAPAFLVDKVVDPTGAGDSFAGAFFGHLARTGATRDLAHEDPEEWRHLIRRSVLAGCVMASFTVEDFSIHRLMRLEQGELDARTELMYRMISVAQS